MPRYARAVLGGTFDHLHVGHEALLGTAFRLGRSVAIGLTTERYLAAHPKPDGGVIAPFRLRRRALMRWLRRQFPGRSFTVHPLEDRFGGSVGPHVSVLVVSADTSAASDAVNAERVRRGLRPVPVVVVPLVLADDLRPVSSRRVRAGEVDRDGRRRTPLPVELRVEHAGALPWATRAVRSVFPRAHVTSRVVRPSRDFSRDRPRDGLRVEVRARARGGWTVVEAAPRMTLRPRPVDGPGPKEWERGMRELLRPGERRARPNDLSA